MTRLLRQWIAPHKLPADDDFDRAFDRVFLCPIFFSVVRAIGSDKLTGANEKADTTSVRKLAKVRADRRR